MKRLLKNDIPVLKEKRIFLLLLTNYGNKYVQKKNQNNSIQSVDI